MTSALTSLLPSAAGPKKPATDSIDLNYRLVCKDCRTFPPNIVEDYKNGDLICGQCGLVFPMRIIDTRSEWRTFSGGDGDGGDDPSRVGAADNPLLEGVVDQLSTSISGKDGYSGHSAALNRVHGKVVGGHKGDRDVVQSFREIAVMAERIGLPRVVADRAKLLYKKVFDEDHSKGRPNEGIIAACIFLACRQERVARTFKEITMLTRVEKKVIGKCVKSILPLISESERVHTVRHEDYLARFCSHLDLSNLVRNIAAQVVQRATELGILAGKSPLSVCAAAIFMVSQLTQNPKSAKDISPVTGVSDVTIKNAYRDLYARRHEVVPMLDSKLPKSLDELPPPGKEERLESSAAKS